MADLPHLASRLYGTPLLIARLNAIEAGESVAITRQGRRDRPAGAGCSEHGARGLSVILGQS